MGVVHYTSPSARLVLAVDETAFLGRTLPDAVHPDDLDRFLAALVDAKGDRSPVIQFRLRHSDGSWLWFESVLRDLLQQPNINGLVLNAREITERKRVEDKLRAEKEFSDSVIQSLPAVFCIFDETAKILRWNAAFEKITGYAAQEISRLKVFDTVAPQDRDLMRHKLQEAFAKGISEADGLLLHKDGTQVPAYFTARPISVDGKPCIAGVAMNISALKQAQEELKFRNVLLSTQQEVSIDGILVVDGAGKIISFNQQFVEMWGISRALMETRLDETVLQSVLDNVVNAERFLEKIRFLYEHREETSRDEVCLRDGRTLDRYSAPMFGADRKYYGRVWNYRDITERKRAEQALLDGEERLRLLLESTAEAIYGIDLQGHCTFCNPACLRLLEYQHADELLGKNMHDLIHHSHPDGTTLPVDECRIFRAFKKGEGIHVDDEVLWKAAGTSFPVEYWSYPQRRGTEVIGAVVTFVDITERRQTEQHRQQAQKMEAIGQLAAGIAHEINTPIQYVGDNTNFLKESWASVLRLLSAVRQTLAHAGGGGVSDEVFKQLASCCETADIDYLEGEIPRAIDQSLEGIERVAKIVRAMKEFSHPGSEEKREVDINKAIETTITVARSEWKYVADVDTNFDANLPLVPCYAGEFNQVILNLLINAAHAIRQAVGDGAQGKGRITISTRCDGSWTEISMRDTGVGIPESIQSRVFEPFFTTKPLGKGTGQGLALAHNTIVRRHGGKIWFESEVGKGTTFFIRLPLAASANAATAASI